MAHLVTLGDSFEIQCLRLLTKLGNFIEVLFDIFLNSVLLHAIVELNKRLHLLLLRVSQFSLRGDQSWIVRLLSSFFNRHRSCRRFKYSFKSSKVLFPWNNRLGLTLCFLDLVFFLLFHVFHSIIMIIKITIKAIFSHEIK